MADSANIPEAVIAALATIRLAPSGHRAPRLWTAERAGPLGQIQPRVLFAADGYYHGKKFESTLLLRELLPRLPSLVLRC